MSIAFIIVTLLGAAMAAFSGISIFRGAAFVVEPLATYGVPRSWWTWLATAKVAGGLGMVVGLFVPVIGIAAAIGLVLYFGGAVITVLRARSYGHVAFPLIYMAPAVGSLVLAFAS
ncbi:membrane protein [Longispora fulva]|uniref:ABC-type antimicrobial peptide transport system permease subunit n=1 Tax=Longispora fulva TaxID=619741 RepID=A0A8J7GFQ2_9ACTN|nr:DoxX family protein [Longispora fulva]MBG6139863.1 ABC-type antimicrobial peptide transport system permease subunit [Longispora fulva]GIG57752.1 membrane protein [Longispora fulva]